MTDLTLFTTRKSTLSINNSSISNFINENGYLMTTRIVINFIIKIITILLD